MDPWSVNNVLDPTYFESPRKQARVAESKEIFKKYIFSRPHRENILKNENLHNFLYFFARKQVPPEKNDINNFF